MKASSLKIKHKTKQNKQLSKSPCRCLGVKGSQLGSFTPEAIVN